MTRIPMEHIDSICSLESELSFGCICPVGTLDISGVIAKMLKSFKINLMDNITMSPIDTLQHHCIFRMRHLALGEFVQSLQLNKK